MSDRLRKGEKISDALSLSRSLSVSLAPGATAAKAAAKICGRMVVVVRRWFPPFSLSIPGSDAKKREDEAKGGHENCRTEGRIIALPRNGVIRIE